LPDSCVFCEIAAGRAPASVVYEDHLTLAFMDLAQPSRGHSLVVPKRHVQDIFSLDDDLGAALFTATRRVAQATRLAFDPEALTIWQQNGRPWQEVLHLHCHVLPRWRGDGVFRPWKDVKPSPRAELDRQARLIRKALPGVSYGS
jgi:histidine triad (HIT) family protein